MKSIILAATLTIIATFNVQAAETKEQYIEKCNIISDIAKDVMTARQFDVSMQEMLQAAQGNKLFVMLIEQAYEYSVLDTEEYKQKYIKQYSDKVFKDCYNANKKKSEKEAV